MITTFGHITKVKLKKKEKKKRVKTVVNLPPKKSLKINKCFKIWHINREFVTNYFLYSFFWGGGGGINNFLKKKLKKKKKFFFGL